MSTYRKKLIEVALPLEAINVASAREKSIRHGHPSTLHLWWARRPLAAARAVLFAQLVDDPSSWPELFPTDEEQNTERQRLFRLIEDLVQWANSNNETVINAARLEIARTHARTASSAKAKVILDDGVKPELVNAYLVTELPPVHDPFAGGGTIPLEAQRLGLRAIASDLNPVAVMINKALIEIPPKFAGLAPMNPATHGNGKLNIWKGAAGLAEDVRYYGAWMREEAKKRIGHLYPDLPLAKEHGGGRATIIAWLWARTVESPNPAFKGCEVPLVSSFWLSKKEGKAAWVQPVVSGDSRSYRFEVRHGMPEDVQSVEHGTRAGKAQDFRCLMSGVPIEREYIRAEGKAGRLGQRLMAIAAVAPGRSGRIYVAGTPDLERAARLAHDDPRVAEARKTFLSGATPSRAMITGGVCSAYGLATWGDLFTARQLVSLCTICELVRAAHAQVLADARRTTLKAVSDAREYADAVALFLSFVLDKMAETLSSLCTWSSAPKNELIVSTFRRQALPMTWDFAEANPFCESSGSIDKIIQSVARVVDELTGTAKAVVTQRDARRAFSEAGLVSTDPPYFDNIGYADLSDFFYVWLREAVRPFYPKELATVLAPKDDELVATTFRHGSKDAAGQFFVDGMKEALAAVAAASSGDAPHALYYAFKQSEADAEGTSSTGWETFLEAILSCGLEVDGTWPIRTERAGRSTGIETNALASSIVLACRPRTRLAPTTTRGEFRRMLRKELPDALRKLQQGNIAPVDVAQASIGPGMAIFSRHKEVAEADGTPMSVRSALQLINEVLDEYLASGEGDFDSDTRFAITWYEQHGWEAGAYGDAENIAKARNISVKGVVDAGVARSGAGKVSLLRRDELPSDYDPRADERPTVWEFTQHMIRYLEEQGEAAAAALLKRLGSRAEATRDLAYRLYNTCERKKWADDARSYNGLILAWPELEKLAARMGDDVPVAAPSRPGKKGKKTKPTTKGQQGLFEGDET